MKIVLDVGQCDFDHSQLRALIEPLGARVLRAITHAEALEQAKKEKPALILVNRINDRDRSKGIDFIKQLKGDPEFAATPVMLISNYEEAQAAALAVGAVRGFGKDALEDPRTIELMRNIIGR